MISQWNSTIKSNDIVYHLGDFGDASIISKLNGKIYLIPGNYDNENIIR